MAETDAVAILTSGLSKDYGSGRGLFDLDFGLANGADLVDLGVLAAVTGTLTTLAIVWHIAQGSARLDVLPREVVDTADRWPSAE